jgi:signal transduction histidine kinase
MDESDQFRDTIVELHRNGDAAKAYALHSRNLWDVVSQIQQTVRELIAFGQQRAEALRAASIRQTRRLQRMLWGVVALAIFLGVIGGWMIAGSVAYRLRRSETLAALGHMAGLVAHEVRNPLTAVKMRIHSLQDAVITDSGRDDLNVIEHEINRLHHLTDRFLSLGRVPEPQFQIVALHGLLVRSLAIFEPSISRQPIRLTRQLAAEPASVRADPEQMVQVLLNILTNAAEAMPGGGRIDVGLRLTCSEEGVSPLAEISVADTGTGFPRHSQKRMFQPFFTTKPNGSGLGLPLAKQVVTQHHGDIEMRSTRSGTTVIISLPLAQSPVAAA